MASTTSELTGGVAAAGVVSRLGPEAGVSRLGPDTGVSRLGADTDAVAFRRDLLGGLGGVVGASAAADSMD